MRYVQKAHELRCVMTILASHQQEIKQYYLAGIKPRVAAAERVEDRLRALFVIASADRRSTGKNNRSLITATDTFVQGLSAKIQECADMEPEQAHQRFWTWLCDLPGMNQKTANLFLKYVVMLHNELHLGTANWQEWEPYLHVPLDIWVVRLIGNEYVNVCNSEFDADFQNGAPRSKKAYQALQNDIREVTATTGHAAIVLDTLWFVGSKYCRHHPLFCESCWIAAQCKREKGTDRESSASLLKSHHRKAVRQAKKELIARYPEEYRRLCDGFRVRTNMASGGEGNSTTV